ncbi:MAG: type II toxin-antitoxin system PemK/MazF family toxin [Deltaproteobacteria bacterium]|nr:type II toxin-antitoxin system PemK/MazF family toxin [Deltaproteobacteria bacterium]
MPYKRGDVVLVLYPNSDLQSAKKRPALVVQSDEIETGLPQRVVAMITSNLDRKGPTRVMVGRDTSEGRFMGILTDSVIVMDNVATVLDREIEQKIGEKPDMNSVTEALRRVFDL